MCVCVWDRLARHLSLTHKEIVSGIKSQKWPFSSPCDAYGIPKRIQQQAIAERIHERMGKLPEKTRRMNTNNKSQLTLSVCGGYAVWCVRVCMPCTEWENSKTDQKNIWQSDDQNLSTTNMGQKYRNVSPNIRIIDFAQWQMIFLEPHNGDNFVFIFPFCRSLFWGGGAFFSQYEHSFLLFISHDGEPGPSWCVKCFAGPTQRKVKISDNFGTSGEGLQCMASFIHCAQRQSVQSLDLLGLNSIGSQLRLIGID